MLGAPEVEVSRPVEEVIDIHRSQFRTDLTVKGYTSTVMTQAGKRWKQSADIGHENLWHVIPQAVAYADQKKAVLFSHLDALGPGRKEYQINREAERPLLWFGGRRLVWEASSSSSPALLPPHPWNDILLAVNLCDTSVIILPEVKENGKVHKMDTTSLSKLKLSREQQSGQ
ncbi:hypothetical protein AV530_010013 [Patagioenas fasciata monilis]|uniref:Uncharacterized protein n=1 Tax=Patagioenas fasciata monilis TaxID=372326 RepID=A0A1V4KB67_PATFA|nr:hypothetical protein AV530_010013 [Patagioenas fasciata monilis]